MPNLNIEEVFVTQPDFPDKEKFKKMIDEIWDNKILTNAGPFHEKFEEELANYLGVKNISLFTNATIALVIALQALDIEGEVITTPYSFVATSHSLVWNKIKPVFVDVQKDNLNIDPKKIESSITDNTTAIMAVHCYGNPCDVDKIEEIAKKYNLKVIYDAAHAFGVDCHCGSLLDHGDLSVLSFHATKVFNTLEGGAIISPDKKTKSKIDRLKNYGIISQTEVQGLGINGKMDEFRSAYGLLQLSEVDRVYEKRKKIFNMYRDMLKDIKGLKFLEPNQKPKKYNYAYFPILISDEFAISRDELFNHLKANSIYARRYFYPLITEYSSYKKMEDVNSSNYPIALQASKEILCLPIYPNLSLEIVQIISNLIKKVSF